MTAEPTGNATYKGAPMEPLSDQEVNRLATYNAEVARGLMHTPEWAAEMAGLQRRFNEHGYVSADRDRLIGKFFGGAR